MRRFITLLLGAVVFTAIQVVLVAEEAAWFGGGRYPPWFMNSNATVLFAVAVFGVVGGAAAVLRRRPSMYVVVLDAVCLAVGGAVPMMIRLFTMPGGPGNLFPIAIGIGFLVLLVGAVTGALTGWAMREFAARVHSGR